jgi:hypothetical protein
MCVLECWTAPGLYFNVSFGDWNKLDSGGDVVNMWLKMLWDMIPIALVSRSPALLFKIEALSYLSHPILMFELDLCSCS